jgi:hypothetical protein
MCRGNSSELKSRLEKENLIDGERKQALDCSYGRFFQSLIERRPGVRSETERNRVSFQC